MENCLNKAELLEKFNLYYDSLNKILNYLKLPFEIKTSANYKKVPYYNQESINKIEEFLKDKSSNDVANFFRNLARLRKGYSIPMIAEELKKTTKRSLKELHKYNDSISLFDNLYQCSPTEMPSDDFFFGRLT